MRVLADLREGDHRVTRWVASWRSTCVRRFLPAVEESAEHTKLWWATAASLASMAVAELASNCVLKHVWHRCRPPKEWISHEEVHDRPDSSSFPSGHTAAGMAFRAAVALVWPWAGAVCAVPAVMVAAERVHTGAHYPSDVAVGATIGLAAAALVSRAPRLAVRLLR
ncbi:phosphatase PAP2 family protein [Streptomyces coeruleorubidus]|uniref:phosphatase PAP2 family protein n=1 Tax=Streptomyces coeruleorubidus TaxID=116188 RepID=UPI0033F6216D